MSQQLSISFRVDKGCIEHNNREIIKDNVDVTRIPDNITYRKIDIKEFYGQLFDKALADYNAKRRPYLRIPNYYEHIRNGKQEKPFEEIVVQFGDKDTCGLGSENWETAKKMLDVYMRDFEKRNPNLKVFNACVHLDESCPHLHIDFVPICHSPDRGLSTRVSMKGALKEMGFSSSSKKQNEWIAWERREQEEMTKILIAHGLSRDIKNNSLAHLPVEDFKAKKAAEAEKEKLDAELAILHRTPPEQIISAEDLFLIKNENDLLREENYKIATTAKKILDRQQAQFVELEIFNPDKLEYICGTLRGNKIPFVEGACSVHFPDYAQNFVNRLLEKYKPAPTNIRERVKLDIDRLILSADSFDDLMEKLKTLGYEIKQGKYISIKPPFAVKNIRVERLGEEYLRENIEKRIAEAKADIKTAQECYDSGNVTERYILKAEISLMTEMTALRITPEKTDSEKPYSFRNEKKINTMLRALSTMNELNISSSYRMYSLAEELEQRIESRKLINYDTAKEQEQLEMLSELIKVYEVVVKGNYIDNLVRAEQERQAAEQRADEERRAAAERKKQAELAAKQREETAARQKSPAPEQAKSQHNKPNKHGRR